MSITYPLIRADFMDLLPVQDVRFFIGQQHQLAGTGGGEILKAEVAPPLWRGSVDLAPMKARQAAEVEALLSGLEVPGRTFEVYKKNQIGPAADPLGAALSGFSPVINNLDPDNERLKFGGLPDGYEISAGDFVSFAYGATCALHRIAQGRIAAADGITASHCTVVPHIRPGAAVATAVEFIKPYCMAVLVPGAVNFGTTRNGITSGVSFQFQQTLR